MACTVRVSRPTQDDPLHLGQTIEIEWTVEGAASQQLEVSIDGGVTYAPIAKDLAADVRSFAWTIPHELLGDDPTPRDARFRVVARDAEDETAIGLGERVTILPKRVVLEPPPVVPAREGFSAAEASAPDPEPPAIVETKAKDEPYEDAKEAEKQAPNDAPPQAPEPTREASPPKGPAPRITSIEPKRDRVLGGARVVIAGEHFTEEARVEFGGVAVAAKLEDGRLVAVAPPRIVEGRVDVRVLTDAGSDVSESAFEYLAQAPPVITSVSPTSGPVAGGTAITLSGRDFVDGATVEIDGVATTVERIEPTSIVALTPPHLAASIADVVVRNPDGQRSVLAGAFSYLREGSGPKITRVIPSRGPARGGTRLVVVGEGFGEGARVDLGGVDVPSTLEAAASERELVVVTPRRSTGGAVWVRVTRPDGAFDVAPDAFVYDEPLPPPKIHSFSPAKHVLGSEEKIVVEGEAFQEGCIVGFDGRDVVATFESATRVTVLPPPHSQGVVDVRVVNPDGGVDVRAQCFEYVLPPAGPAIVGVRPNKGSILGGTTITLRGTNFEPRTRVELSGLEVRCAVHDANTIELTPPPKNASCFVDVAVINPDGASFVLPAGFFYETLAAPVIEGVEPLKGPAAGGIEVTVHGQNFVVHARTTVRFGDRAATMIKASETALVVKAPPGEAGLVDVSVQLPDDQLVTSKSVFKYESTPPPELATITPKNGPVTGGTRVTLMGKNFIVGTRTLVGGEPVTAARIVNASTLEVTIPRGKSPGLVDVEVRNPDGQRAALKNAFQYDAVPPPELTSVTPKYGSASGGERVTLLGKSFVEGMTVTMGGVACKTVKLIDGKTLEVVAPPQSSTGMVDVVVKNATGASATMKLAFQYTR